MNNYSYEQKIIMFKNDIKKIKHKLNYYFSNKLLDDPNENNYILKQNFFIIEQIFYDIENNFVDMKDNIINKSEEEIIMDKVSNITDNIQLILFLTTKYNIETEQFYNKINDLAKNKNNDDNIENFGVSSIKKAAKKLADKEVKKILKPIEKTFKNIFSSITGIFSKIGKLVQPIIDIAKKYILPILDWLVMLAKMFLYLIEKLIPTIFKFLYKFVIDFYNKALQTWMVVPIVYVVLHRFIPKYIDYVIVDLLRAFGEKTKFNNIEEKLGDEHVKTISLVLTIFFTWILFWKNTKTLVTLKNYIISIGLYTLLKFYDLIKFILLNLFKLPGDSKFFTDVGNLKDPKFLKKKVLQLIDLIINNIEKFVILLLIYFIIIVALFKNILPRFSKTIPTQKEFFLYFKILIYKLLNLNK